VTVVYFQLVASLGGALMGFWILVGVLGALWIALR
jgi:hypothetical protein